MQVSTSPRLKRPICIIRIDELAFPRSGLGIERGERLPVRGDSVDESKLGKGDELIVAVRPRSIQLLGLEAERIFRPTAVAQPALAAAEERPHELLVKLCLQYMDTAFLKLRRGLLRAARDGEWRWLSSGLLLAALYGLITHQIAA